MTANAIKTQFTIATGGDDKHNRPSLWAPYGLHRPRSTNISGRAPN